MCRRKGVHQHLVEIANRGHRDTGLLREPGEVHYAARFGSRPRSESGRRPPTSRTTASRRISLLQVDFGIGGERRRATRDRFGCHAWQACPTPGDLPDPAAAGKPRFAGTTGSGGRIADAPVPVRSGAITGNRRKECARPGRRLAAPARRRRAELPVTEELEPRWEAIKEILDVVEQTGDLLDLVDANHKAPVFARFQLGCQSSRGPLVAETFARIL